MQLGEIQDIFARRQVRIEARLVRQDADRAPRR
jgi:hypothetical protein